MSIRFRKHLVLISLATWLLLQVLSTLISSHSSFTRTPPCHRISSSVRHVELDIKSSLTTHPFPQSSSKCRDYTVKLAKVESLPPTALASAPGSGNTWLRHMLELATGLYTGSVFNDTSLFDKGFKGELQLFSRGTTIVQKTHHNAIVKVNRSLEWRMDTVKLGPFQGRAVLIIRDPAKALVSHYNYLGTRHNHTGLVDFGAMNANELKVFNDFAVEAAERWLQLIEDWINFGADVDIHFYEHILTQPIEEVREIVQYLNIDKIDDLEGRLECLHDFIKGKFKREQSKEQEQRSMSALWPKTIEAILEAIHKAHELVKRCRGQGLPLDLYYFK